MKRILMAIMAVAVAVTFSAPAFAGDPPKDTTKEEKKAPKHMLYGDEDKKKDEEKKKGGNVDTFGDEGKKPEEKKKDGK
jgi:Ni/Co efflux regulator RcnB